MDSASCPFLFCFFAGVVKYKFLWEMTIVAEVETCFINTLRFLLQARADSRPLLHNSRRNIEVGLVYNYGAQTRARGLC